MSTVFFLETSDHSDIESRVRRLKDQLEVRKREVKRLYNERKKQRKAMLRAQEASLRQELQVTFVLKCANALRALGLVIDVTLTCTSRAPSTLICHESRAFRESSLNRTNSKTLPLRFSVNGKGAL